MPAIKILAVEENDSLMLLGFGGKTECKNYYGEDI